MGVFTVEKNGIYKGGRLIALLGGAPDAEDGLHECGEGVYEWRRSVRVEGEEKQDFRNLTMTLRIMERPDFYMAPGINYNGNYWGDGREPKGLGTQDIPWKFAGHRTTVPAGMYCQNTQAAFGLFGESGDAGGFCGFMREEADGAFTLNLQFPETEEPRVYCARDAYEEGPYRAAGVWDTDEIELCAVLVLKERSQEYDYDRFLNVAWRRFEEKAKPVRTKEEVWRLGFRFLKESVFFRDKGFSGFCMGLTWKEDRWVQKRDHLEIGWVGQNASLAVSLLYRYAVEGDRESLFTGLEILDCWASRAPLQNGLFRCRFDRILKYGENTANREERNDAANLCSAVEEYLEAFYLLQSLEEGIRRDNYRSLALDICGFVISIQGEDGRLGKAWYNDGTCSDEEGTVGCYLAKALCVAFRYEKDAAFLKAAKKGYRYYYREFIEYGYTTAGALDTCCVDKESAIPLFCTALMLYEYEGEEEYLRQAVKISNYLATWQYHYNVPFGGHTVLGQTGYKTRGGTAVSVQHNHIDCYGLEFYEDFIKLAKYTGDGVYRERAQAIWDNSLYNISDGRLVIKGQKRPAGSQDEGFLQTRWHTKRGEYFGVSEWLVTWNTAFRLKILRKEYLARKRELRKDEANI